MNRKIFSLGFTLIEVLVALLIILIISLMALPYYQQAVESAHAAEAILWWGRLKNQAAGLNLSRTHSRIENDINENGKLKHFTLQLQCRPPALDNPNPSEPCWEATFHLQKPQQSIQYFLTTQHNFAQLLCVPINSAGTAFCQSQATAEHEEPLSFEQQNAYLLHH